MKMFIRLSILSGGECCELQKSI